MTTFKKPFIIVGGGIGGIAAAIALSQKGYAVHVIEQAPEFAEIGAGIQLGPNIVRALDRLGIKKQVMDISWLPPALVMRDALDGHEITKVPVKEIFPLHYKENYAVVHRADLHACMLLKAAANPLITLQRYAHLTDARIAEAALRYDPSGTARAPLGTISADSDEKTML